MFLWFYATQFVVIWYHSCRKGVQASYPVGSLGKLSRRSLEVPEVGHSQPGLGVRREEADSSGEVLPILDFDLE